MRKISIYIFIFFVALSARAQEADLRERVYLHVNSSLLLTGETLYFSAYAKSEATGKPSRLSKILYVELVGRNGPVFQQKVELKNGRGRGDFFVPSVVSTGRYQLIAYTRWMRNFEDYFQTPVSIVNPYEEYVKPKERESGRVAMTFYPNQGKLVQALNNTVAYTIDRGGNDSLKFNAKLVDEAGEVILNFEPKEKAFGQFLFRPDADKQYQVILEDQSGAFTFVNLPEVSRSGTILQILEKTRFFEVNLETYPRNSELGNITVSNMQNVLFDRSVELDSRINVPKENLGTGVLKFRVADGNGEERAIAYRHLTAQNPSIESLNKSYSNREEVEMPLDLDSGLYSVSVRRKADNFENEWVHSTHEDFFLKYGVSGEHIEKFLQSSEDQIPAEFPFILPARSAFDSSYTQVEFLPEFRDELITGTVTDAQTKPLEDVTVTMSFPGKVFQFQAGQTDANGRFCLSFSNPVETREAYFTLFDYDGRYYNIQVDEKFLTEYPAFEYRDLDLDTLQIQEVIERSVRNQIENAYYTRKKDIILSRDEWLPQIDHEYFYMLDEYTRFASMEEHFVEYIFNASIRPNRDQIFNFLLKYPRKDFDSEPLVLLDGIPVPDSTVVDYDPYNLESIGIVNNRYFLGNLVVDGVVSLGTYQGDLIKYSLDNQVVKKSVVGISPQKKYYKPDYASDPMDRIPDQREQLLWVPDLSVDSEGEIILDFYTSDVDGVYEMVLEGFNALGEPVTIIKTFNVE